MEKINKVSRFLWENHNINISGWTGLWNIAEEGKLKDIVFPRKISKTIIGFDYGFLRYLSFPLPWLIDFFYSGYFTKDYRNTNYLIMYQDLRGDLDFINKVRKHSTFNENMINFFQDTGVPAIGLNTDRDSVFGVIENGLNLKSITRSLSIPITPVSIFRERWTKDKSLRLKISTTSGNVILDLTNYQIVECNPSETISEGTGYNRKYYSKDYKIVEGGKIWRTVK